MSKISEFKGPRSICDCGHTGDGPGSQHSAWAGERYVRSGQGSCSVIGCTCQQFTWWSWTPEFRALIAEDAEANPPRCPTCDSPAPHLHPAMQHEGEVQPCSDPWHKGGN